jgi:hypothetical protein
MLTSKGTEARCFGPFERSLKRFLLIILGEAKEKRVQLSEPEGRVSEPQYDQKTISTKREGTGASGFMAKHLHNPSGGSQVWGTHFRDALLFT